MPRPNPGRGAYGFRKRKAAYIGVTEYGLCEASEFLININMRL